MDAAPSISLGYAAALGCAVLAGFAFTVFKLVDPAVPALTSVLVMSLVGTGVFALLRGLRGSWAPPRPDADAARMVIVQSALTFGGMWGIWSGVARIDPAVASFLGRTESVFSLMAGVLLLGERFRRAEIPGALVALAGLAILLGDGLRRAGADAFGEGALRILGGAGVLGLSEVWAKRAMARMSPLDFALCRAALLSAAFGLAAALTGSLVLPAREDILYAALAGLLAPTLARLLFLVSLRSLDLAKAVTVNLTQPLFAGLLAAVWLGTSPPRAQWAGGLVALGGCALLVRARRVRPA